MNLAINQIKVIPDGLFRNLANLDDLNLQRNEINLLNQSVNIFQGLNKLKSITLAENQIEQIPHGLFSSLNHLKAIDFELNPIAYFPEEFFRDLISLKYILVDENLSKEIRFLKEIQQQLLLGAGKKSSIKITKVIRQQDQAIAGSQSQILAN